MGNRIVRRWAALVVVVLCGVSAAAAQDRRVWQGVVVSDKDPADQTEIAIELSATYHPIVQYETSTGSREAVLASAGEVLQFVPPGGGVRTIRVDTLQVSRDRVYLVLSERFERSSGGLLEQSWGRTTQTLVREGDAFRATLENASGTRLSDLDLAVGGDVERNVYRGLLRPR